jgi:PDDEXK-like domain of unknown function (DUF3799)
VISKETTMSDKIWTGRLHFSTLKQMERSAAHFRHACLNPMEATAAMRVGTLVHHYLLGSSSPPVVYDGTRRGKEWDAFLSSHQGAEIFTAKEGAEAREIADASRAHALFREWIGSAEHKELPLEWSMGGVEMATRGVDVLHQYGLLVDLKTCRSSEPTAFERQATQLRYFEQLACYDAACRDNGFEPTAWALYAIESSPPYVPIVLTVSRERIQAARSIVDRWLQRLRVCLETNEWPGYVTAPVSASEAPITLEGLDDLPEVA